MSKESNIDKILRGQTRGYESWYVRYVMQNATYLKNKRKRKASENQAKGPTSK